jgi:hypothetical protein
VAGMSGGPSVDGAASVRGVLGHVGVTPISRHPATKSRLS